MADDRREWFSNHGTERLPKQHIITRQFDTCGISGAACAACFTPPAAFEPHVERVDTLTGQYLSVAGRDLVKPRSVRRVVKLIVTECESLHRVTERLDFTTAQRVVVAVSVYHQFAVLEVVDVFDVDLCRWHDALQSTCDAFCTVYNFFSSLNDYLRISTSLLVLRTISLQ